MNSASYAVVVGLNNYSKGIPALRGAANDARAFQRWLLDPGDRGGRLPPANVSTFIDDGGHDPTDYHSIKTALRNRLAIQPLKNGETGVRERLYVYFAGHGITVQQPGLTPRHRTAFLCLECGRYDYTAQIAASILQEAAQTMVYYKEVVLIMDCCRELMATARVSDFWGLTLTRPYRNFPHFYALYAAKSGQRSREYKTAANSYRGYFTEALVRNLQGATDNQGRVTFTSLSDALYNDFAHQQNHSPDLVPPDSQTELVFSTQGRVPPSSLTIDAGACHGRPGTLTIIDPRGQQASIPLQDQHTALVLENVQPGLYTLLLHLRDGPVLSPEQSVRCVKVGVGKAVCVPFLEAANEVCVP